jgi:hypothetical protein
MVRYTAWLGLLGTVAAISMQTYFSAVNKYFRGNQLPPALQTPTSTHHVIAKASAPLQAWVD